MLKPAKVIKGLTSPPALALARVQSPPRRAQVIRRSLVEAHERAAEVLAGAQNEAARLISAAQREAAALRQAGFEEGRQQGHAEVIGQAALLGTLARQADERSLDRSIELARILAERLLGKGLALDPELVASLARQVLSEVRGAREIRLLAHPEDCELLRKSVVLERGGGFSLIEEPSLCRGSMRVVTDIGVVEAALGERLDLLTLKLAETLKLGSS